MGFGASGTLLTFAGGRLRRQFAHSCVGLSLLFGLAAALAFRAAEAVPLDVRYVLYSGRQAALMLLYHLLAFVPFFVGATVIGLALTHHADRAHFVYGANLVGSGAGGVLALGLMFLMPAERVLEAAALLGPAAALVSPAGRCQWGTWADHG